MAEFSSLCPGYKQVDAFGPDEEYEEEEVVYVTLDLGNVEPSLVPSSSHYRLIGEVGSGYSDPIFATVRYDFEGPARQVLGNRVIIHRRKGYAGSYALHGSLDMNRALDPSDTSKRVITHVANAEQRITFKEVQLKPKQNTDAMPVEKDGKMGVDDITGKNEPSQRRTRAPRRPREAPPPPQVEDTGTGEPQGSGETDDIAEEKSASEILGEEPAAMEGAVPHTALVEGDATGRDA
ncbi:TFIIIC-sub6 domain-containing protein [Mycena sanguinolenta]|uniref:TFIIIC-sub6 domain-containing protein n=1 Tax=Mycena sanguinolenta TaxID=230812 RepID=A0A8H6YNU8_9AGAR|nr:TFIIIC-sub6 domain-containing protein [Mycena sanguinolenta]